VGRDLERHHGIASRLERDGLAPSPPSILPHTQSLSVSGVGGNQDERLAQRDRRC
jgi:hypothetical protein